MAFTIGQVIYVLSDKTQTVLPGIVREEIHHRSLDGEKVSYRVAIGPPTKQRVVDLATVDGEVYGDLSEVRNVLISRLTAFVDELCNTTAGRVDQWYGSLNKPPGHVQQPGEKLDPSVLMNEMSQQSPATSYPVQQQPQQQPKIAVNTMNGLRNALGDPELSTREYIDADGSIRHVSLTPMNIPTQ